MKMAHGLPNREALVAELPAADAAAARIVLACAQVVPDRDAAAQLVTGADLTPALTLANRHGITPLLFRYLSRPAAAVVPAPILDSLRRHVFGVGRRNLELAGELIRICRLLEREGICALPYKGPTLALQAYGDLAARQFEDLDLLVPPADLDRAIETVHAAGYTLHPQVSPAQYRAYRLSDCEVWMANADETINVELHWAVRERLYAFPLDIDEVAARSRPLRLAGAQVPGIALEDLLLILAAHGIKHAWHRLKWIRDLAGLLALHPELDWDLVLRQAQRLKAERLLLLALLLPHVLLGAPLPGEVLQRAEPEVVSLVAHVARLLLQTRGEEPSRKECHSVYLRSRPGLSERARFLTELAFTPTLAEWESLKLPDPLYPLYHLYRPARLLFRPTADEK
jgi:hypothetical protein